MNHDQQRTEQPIIVHLPTGCPPWEHDVSLCGRYVPTKPVQSAPEPSRAATEAHGDDERGFSMRFDREEWGVIVDALIQHRGHAESRKAANSESTSDLRSEMCADLIGRVNAAALDGDA